MARDLSQDSTTPTEPPRRNVRPSRPLAGDWSPMERIQRDLWNQRPDPAPAPQAPLRPSPNSPAFNDPLRDEMLGGNPDDIVLDEATKWILALGRKASREDVEGAPFPQRLRVGAQVYLARYTGDFGYLLSVRDGLTDRRRGANVLLVPSAGQAAGILNCLRAEEGRKAKAAGFVGTPTAPVAPQRIAVEDSGVYVLPDGTICKVQATKDGARTYAKRLVEIGGERLTEAGTRVNAEYQYEQGLVQRVAAEGRKLTLEEAKALSIRYGWCIRCGRHLKAAQSVEAGMGPICISYFS